LPKSVFHAPWQFISFCRQTAEVLEAAAVTAVSSGQCFLRFIVLFYFYRRSREVTCRSLP